MRFFKTGLLVIAVMGPGSAVAIDTAPYNPGEPLTTDQATELQKRYKQRPTQPWAANKKAEAIDQDKNAELIHYGVLLLDKTAATIGPNVSNTSKRYSGNALNCSSCHLKGASGLPGTKYYGIPFVNLTNDYPNFRSRNMAVGTLASRINGCMTRSMGDGKPLPEESREMQAMLAYFDWLGAGNQPQQAMEGTGLLSIELPARKADTVKGKTVYGQKCQSCHGEAGKGMAAQPGAYIFPPLAGNDSFNDGAGMSRLIKATRFILGNMPLGTDAHKPALTVGDAYDVAAYMESLPRPSKANRGDDFPNPAFRPKDYPVPAYFDGDKEKLQQAKYGPFK